MRVLNERRRTITPRQAAILRATVREYTRTGDPVGSAALRDRLRLTWSSATVRTEFASLEHDGLLARPHHSAGRVPTTSGYRYYVDHCVERVPSPQVATRFERLPGSLESAPTVAALAQDLAELSGTLAVVALAERARGRRARRFTDIHEAGFRRLFRMPEFSERAATAELGRVLDAFEELASVLCASASARPTVLIDGENPWIRTRAVSMIVAANESPDYTIVAALIGSVRMPYDRTISVMEAFHEALS